MTESINKETLRGLIEFPQPFKDASDNLEEKCPTLPLVALNVSMLEKHLEDAPQSTDAAEILKIKTRVRHFLATKMKIAILYKSLTLPWPHFSQLEMLPEDKRLEVYRCVRHPLSLTGDVPHDGTQETSSKRNCFGVFRDWCNTQNDKTA